MPGGLVSPLCDIGQCRVGTLSSTKGSGFTLTSQDIASEQTATVWAKDDFTRASARQPW
jgi:hypothetical protein